MGKPVNVVSFFNISTLNSLWQITTSEKLKHNDPRMRRLVDALDKIFKDHAKPHVQVITMIPPFIKSDMF